MRSIFFKNNIHFKPHLIFVIMRKVQLTLMDQMYYLRYSLIRPPWTPVLFSSTDLITVYIFTQYYFAVKVLVTTGTESPNYPPHLSTNNEPETEIIDLNNSKIKPTVLANLPWVKRYGCVGGILQYKYPLICGGYQRSVPSPGRHRPLWHYILLP